MRALFNEKEKELAVAVSKVDQLMSQLQELRGTRGKGIITNGNSSKADGAALALELEKLRKELQVGGVAVVMVQWSNAAS